IRDSDDEDEEEDLDDAYEMGDETQGVVHGLLQSSAHLQTDSGVGTHDDIQGSGSVDEPDPTFPNHHQEGSVSYENNNSFSNNNADSKHTQVNHQSNTHPHPRSISEEVSAQLTNDLYHQTQHHSPLTLSPRLLDSQSQIGFMWREYTPSLPDDGPEQEQEQEQEQKHDHDHDHGNNSSPIQTTTPTLSLEEEEEEEEEEGQLRTSQVSTLDPTQPSPSPRGPQSQTPTQNQQFPSSQLHPPSSLHQSSPPPFLPSLSSPSPSPSRSRSRLRAVPHESNLDLDLGSVDVGEGRVFEREFDEYDGKVLTVSQLLPESMLNENESLDMPPLFSSQQSLEEEG
ncbi:MAG: hypothetical protein M1830_005338, partial [Pleopsidium flavum]